LLFSVGIYAQIRLFRRAASGATAAVDLNVRGFSATSWSPDGKTLLLRKSHETNSDIFALSMADNAQPEPLLATPSEELGATLSPDGRWLAYSSNESGRREVYVRPFPELDGGKWLISTDGGTWPLWTRAGRELVYLSGTKLMAVPVSADESFKPGVPKEVFNRPYLTRPGARNYDVSPDGEGFLFVREGGVSIHLVQNWSEELKAKVP
jgi:serine/threonine-protein kinase